MSVFAYGQRLGQSFNIDDPPTLVTRTSRDFPLAVTELRSDKPATGPSAPIRGQEGYWIFVHLRALDAYEVRLNGQSLPVRSAGVGHTSFYDLKQDPVIYIDGPFHFLNFYISRDALVEFAEILDVSAVNDLAWECCEPIEDPIIFQIGKCLLHAMNAGMPMNKMFVDHLLFALLGHLVMKYGGFKAPYSHAHGGLPSWMLRKSMQLMRENLVGGIALVDVANECGISVSCFVRLFKKSTGFSPHQWLVLQRIEKSIELMRDRKASLTHIAIASGFSDQSHFTRTFTRKMGVSPSVWRSSCDD
ncbi:helix-turn-helix transcriptional regulator [Dyella flava]|uniref:Helix-turn-helix transcriptional regulator n=1 Tax=Dyella flava TaxID=1920170 RepID=A0ABS2K2D3_9GAMM|nr:AraC family transcriptional regulator [Dyella flava]MBM7124478.1 helix-turn-helix transcriptional regulator [Dyella flava]